MIKDNSFLENANNSIFLENSFSDLLIVSGFFNQDIVNSSIKIIEEKLINLNYSKNIITRTKLLSVEILENIYKHQKSVENIKPFFNLLIFENEIKIHSGNTISEKGYKFLSERLSFLSSTNDTVINDIYVNELLNGGLSIEGNAGLGLLTIFKRSKNKVSYNFEQLDDKNYFFDLKVVV